MIFVKVHSSAYHSAMKTYIAGSRGELLIIKTGYKYDEYPWTSPAVRSAYWIMFSCMDKEEE